MKTVNSENRISTSRRIAELGLPARQQVKALETLALVDALIRPFFGKSDAAKTPAIRPVLKAQ